MVPSPGKKFIIIRQEVASPQPGLFVGFDSFAKSPVDGEMDSAFDVPDAGISPKGDMKKRWSLLGKVLSLSNNASPTSTRHSKGSAWEENLQKVRRDMSEVRTRVTSASTTLKASGDVSDGFNEDSGDSSPIYEEQKHIFKFFLGWHQGSSPPRERVLKRPRLPGPAQARISNRSRRNASSPATYGPRPSLQRGLISEARNAIPLTLPENGGVKSGAMDVQELDSQTTGEPSAETSGGTYEDGDSPGEPATHPKNPVGIGAKNAIYTGRALAEWAQVVLECDSFVERRQDEGILDLCDIEVPLLDVESFRRLGG